MMKKYLFAILISLIMLSSAVAATRTFSVSGRVVNEDTREPLSYVAVTIDGQPQRGAVTDLNGEFTITGAEPGIFRLVGQSLGYEVGYSPDVQISAMIQPVEIGLVASSSKIDTIVVRPSLFRRMVESPVSLRRIGAQQIEKSPGANRDVSRIVQSYPGVSFSPSGYRNDLIVRGGAPSENKFYVDGIEIPNINHFSTQGASGGPVSILNADLIREIDFYTAAFPVQCSGALSSVLDVKLRDGDPDGQQFKVTLGASEASFSGSGHFSDKTNYIFSIRQSYLQFLFKMIGLPFLPNFIDGQVKVKHAISPKDELVFLGLMGIDDMELNEEGTTETSEYILGYLPEIEQETFTTGVRYRHYSGSSSYSVVASHSYLNSQYTKYQDNDDSDSQKLNTLLKSRDQKSTLRSENKSILSENFTITYGALAEYSQFTIDSYTRYASGENYYDTDLNIFNWGVHVGSSYKSNNERFTASLGVRADANNFSKDTQRFWEQISPRATASYALQYGFSLSAATGIYYAMPSSTALSYREDGIDVNSDLSYIDVTHYTLGVEWQKDRQISLSMEGFYKHYNDLPVSVENDIPLADLGDDYGVVGNEYLLQTGCGRAYGLEFMGQWQILGKVSLVGSFTLFRSEYATSAESEYRPSSWDNRFILNASGTYFFKKGWSAGAKISAIGGSPYTPYDVDYSSQIINWDISGQPTLDYTLYNTERTQSYAQIDLRADKMFYFSRWTLGLYVDLQNAFISEFRQQDIPVSTGEVDPNDSSRYVMKYLNNVSGTMLPTIGITAQF